MSKFVISQPQINSTLIALSSGAQFPSPPFGTQTPYGQAYANRKDMMSVVGASGTLNPLGANLIYLEIYAGSVPVNFTGFTNANQRISDLLIQFPIGDQNGESVQETGDARKLLIAKCLSAKVATNSGVATWFLIRAEGDVDASPANAGDLVTAGAIIGTVGALGSGSDLEIADTTVISGNLYKSAGVLYNMPIEYTLT